MKQKFKPVARLEIRERVEARFRARGSLRFHLLLVVGALLILLYSALNYWVFWSEFQSISGLLVRYRDSILAVCLLSTSAALHAIHYYFRHGRGRERHEVETERRVDEQLRGAAAEDADEQEELVRLQQADKLKNRRLILWHLALYVGIMCLMVFVHPINTRELLPLQSGNMAGTADHRWHMGNRAGGAFAALRKRLWCCREKARGQD